MKLRDWRLKVAVQFVLAHVPGGEKLNHALQRMHRNADRRRRDVADKLPEICAGLQMIGRHMKIEGAEVVEMGTGWRPLPTVLLHLWGARTIHTFDHEAHLRLPLAIEMLDVMSEHADAIATASGLPKADIVARLRKLQACRSLEEMLATAGIAYHAPADSTRTLLPPSSCDLFYSNEVL